MPRVEEKKQVRRGTDRSERSQMLNVFLYTSDPDFFHSLKMDLWQHGIRVSLNPSLTGNRVQPNLVLMDKDSRRSAQYVSTYFAPVLYAAGLYEDRADVTDFLRQHSGFSGYVHQGQCLEWVIANIRKNAKKNPVSVTGRYVSMHEGKAKPSIRKELGLPKESRGDTTRYVYLRLSGRRESGNNA